MKFLILVLLISINCFAMDEHNQRKKAQAFGQEVLLPFINKEDFKSACRKANRERASWVPYSEDWKEITFDQFSQLKEGYTKAEYRYIILKDKEFRAKATHHFCAKALKDFKKKHSQITEIFLTDKKGGVIAASRETTDWFQGDEPKFTEAFNSKSIMVGPRTQDSSAKLQGSHVSIPLVEGDEVICLAIFFVQSPD